MGTVGIRKWASEYLPVMNDSRKSHKTDENEETKTKRNEILEISTTYYCVILE